MKIHYLTIGEVAKLSNISVQTLRYYDQINLFKPFGVNSSNRYRFYQNTQLYYLDIIKSLKYLGLSLEEVKSVLKLKPEELVIYLEDQEKRIEEQFQRLNKTKQVLQRKKEQIQSFVLEPNMMTVSRKNLSEQKIVKIKAHNMKVDDIPNREFGRISKVLEEEGSVFDTLYGGSFPFQRYEFLNDINYDYLFTYIVTNKDFEVKYEDVEISLLPAGEYLSISFVLEDTEYIECYQKLIDYIEEHQLVVDPIVYDVWMPINYSASKEDEFLVELKIPIQTT
ncbi:MerR family transcriptional regulator, activator of bmr gene [Psychrobacillus sp. OK028]|uniref:MerR family transcriptional regulator n=1 Tax=Psychrobacillus sp. OK028 TaxID=1884359 RepID=UPI00088503A1|nr:MerR family transcriptional regulator [Psychrobacillus sp. OK028]SDO21756.1 MerR family transcriptional regulator, activator of bmr gene [Psychrobacillus sp. OK028]